KRWALIGTGWVFILLGLAGLVLPVLQGILFLAIGALILAGASYRVRRWLVALRRRYPRFRTALDAARGWLKRQRRKWRR
ncbi:unnamed protein product, partial [Discosporangium mesarthrocarpum]